MQAFHNDPELKTFVLDQLAIHREADKLIKGTYWESGKGCAVGCTLEAVRQRSGAKTIAHGSHALYEEYLGIPIILARLEGGIFERLDNGKSQAWPERFTKAIKPGADLSGVWPKFAVWLLTDPTDGVIKFAKTDRTRKAIQDVSDAYARGETNKDAWRGLRSADAAADAATYTAYTAYAADADAYAYATAYAADATAAATYAARSKHYEKMADKLIELLEAA